MSRREPIAPSVELVAESNGAHLIQRTTTTGRWPFRKTITTRHCECPFACMAAMEPCEFAGMYGRTGERFAP